MVLVGLGYTTSFPTRVHSGQKITSWFDLHKNDNSDVQMAFRTKQTTQERRIKFLVILSNVFGLLDLLLFFVLLLYNMKTAVFKVQLPKNQQIF